MTKKTLPVQPALSQLETTAHSGLPVTELLPESAWQEALTLRRGWGWLALLLALAAMFLAQLPAGYEFATFVFYDPGVTLRTNHLIAQGFLPTIDFGYPYGLLPLIVGRIFFALAGQTPGSYLLFMFLAEIAIVLGLWRLAEKRNLLILIFLIVALPHAIIPLYVHLTHPMEAALIIHAIADVAIGRRVRALALATACIFVKPSMTFGLGLLLLVWMIARVVRRKERWQPFLFSLLPAIVTGILAALMTVLYFGLTPSINAFLPLTGARSYQALDFGFFGNGKEFWWPKLSGATQYAKYYLFTPAGFWLICTILLAAFGLRSLITLFRNSAGKHEALVTIAACHFFFLLAFFGWPGSWTYYAYLPVAGVATGLTIYRARLAWVLALILLALIGHTGLYRNTVSAWRWTTRSAETAGLWSYPDQRNEWVKARAIAGQREIYYLNNGCPELLFRRVNAPASFFLSPAMQTPKEIERIQQQLEKAEVVVTFNQGPVLDAWYWPEFANQRSAFVDTWQGTYLTVHERKAIAHPSPQP